MIESVKARMVADARALADRFRRMITAPPGAPIDNLDPLAALSGVRQFQVCDPAVGSLQAAAETSDDRAYDRVDPD